MFVVRLRKSRVKAQSIENLFDSPRSRSTPDIAYEDRVSAFHTPRRDSRLTPCPTTVSNSPSNRPDTQSNTLYNSTVNHHVVTAHRAIAVSSTGLNLPVSVGPLRGEKSE